MSSENVEIVRSGFVAWDRRDYGAATSHFSPVVEIDASDRVLNPAVYNGLEGAIRFRDEIAEAWEEFHVEVEDVVPAGDDVVVLVHSSGRGRASGAKVESRAAWVATVRDQRIARLRLYRDRSRALEAVGLSE